MIKDVKNMSIRKVFDTSEASNKILIYQIPSYQREYSWSKADWENLFDDLYGNDENYFLGTIICIVAEHGKFVSNEVIDGQQRLITLSILLLAIYDKLNEIFKGNHNAEFIKNKKFTRHFLGLSDSLYLDNDGLDNVFRLTLSVQKHNRDDYNYLVGKTFNHNGIARPNEFDKRKISLAHKYFSDRLNQIGTNKSEEEKLNIYMDFLDKVNSVSIIKIDVDDASSAFTLFESINNRGVPLSPIDLIKNELIKECAVQNILNADDTNKRWQNIIQYIPDSKQQIRFLKHFCYAFSEEIKLNFPDLSINNITESGLVKIYQDMIHRNPKFILDSLMDCANVYGFILGKNVNIEIYEKDKLIQKLVDLNELQFVPSNSLLLHLFKHYPSENYLALLDFLGDWFLCRHLTDIPSAKKLDTIFFNCIELIRKNKTYNLEVIRHELIQLIDKDAVRLFFEHEDFYKSNNKRVRYFLMRLEMNRRFKENAIDKNQNWTVEHIFPKKPAKGSDWDLYFKTEEDKSYLNKLGNLTLTCFNSTLSNKSFQEKYNAFDKETGNQIGYASGNVKINQSLMGKTCWTVSCIQERTRELTEEFLGLLGN